MGGTCTEIVTKPMGGGGSDAGENIMDCCCCCCINGTWDCGDAAADVRGDVPVVGEPMDGKNEGDDIDKAD